MPSLRVYRRRRISPLGEIGEGDLFNSIVVNEVEKRGLTRDGGGEEERQWGGQEDIDREKVGSQGHVRMEGSLY